MKKKALNKKLGFIKTTIAHLTNGMLENVRGGERTVHTCPTGCAECDTTTVTADCV